MFKFVLQLAKQLLPQQEADAPEANNEGAYDAYMFQNLLALQLNNFFRAYLKTSMLAHAHRNNPG